MLAEKFTLIVFFCNHWEMILMKAIDIISNLSASKNVTPGAPNIKTESKSKLGKAVSNVTYYLSCWMTMAQIQKMQ